MDSTMEEDIDSVIDRSTQTYVAAGGMKGRSVECDVTRALAAGTGLKHTAGIFECVRRPSVYGKLGTRDMVPEPACVAQDTSRASVASCVRTLLKLKLFKKYLRSNMGQQ